MRRKWLIFAGLGLVATLLILAVAIPALAQDPTPIPKTPKIGGGWDRGFGMCGGSWESYDAIAKALGLTPEQLFSELHAGKTLNEIAEEKGVDLQKMQDAAKAAQVEAMKTAIQQAVKDGKLTQEQADWLLKGLELGFMPMGRGFGRGFGHGFGFGGGRGMFRGRAPSATRFVAPRPSSF